MNSDLFDYAESKLRKEVGMAIAAEHRPKALDVTRQIAKQIALGKPDRTCHADEVGEELDKLGIAVGPWCGAIFKESCWVCTGRTVKSQRKTNHARKLEIWRYLL